MDHTTWTIKVLKDPWEFTPFIGMMDRVKFTPVGMTRAVMLSRVMSGKYLAVIAENGEMVSGMAIIEPIGSTCNIIYVTVSPPGLFKKLMAQFLENIKALGYTKIRAWTKHNPKAFERLTGLKTVWTCLEKEL